MSLPPLNPRSSKLGSLAQSARSKKLTQARGIIIALGVLFIIGYTIIMAAARPIAKSLVDQEVKKLGPGMVVDAVERQKAEDLVTKRLIIAGAIGLGLGVVFMVLGFLVRTIPVPATVIALVLYVGTVAVDVAFDPDAWRRWPILKIIIIVALFQAVIAAVAYQKEKNASRAMEPELVEPEYE